MGFSVKGSPIMWSDEAREAAADARAKGSHAQSIDKLPGKMTRAHFELIASNLRSQAASDPAGHNARVSAMADKLATTNPGFKRDLFVKASQPDTSYKNQSTSFSLGNASKSLSRSGYGSK
jgi:hypothetical protein